MNNVQRYKRGLVSGFSGSGRRISLVYQNFSKKIKPFQFRHAEVSTTTQMLIVLEINNRGLKEDVMTPIIQETKLLKEYYSEKKVMGVEFLKGSENHLLLIFNDEALVLKIGGNKIDRYFRIDFSSSLKKETVFQGFYQDCYVFSETTKKSKDKFRLRNVEYLYRHSINDHIRKITDRDSEELDDNDLDLSLERKLNTVDPKGQLD